MLDRVSIITLMQDYHIVMYAHGSATLMFVCFTSSRITGTLKNISHGEFFTSNNRSEKHVLFVMTTQMLDTWHAHKKMCLRINDFWSAHLVL
jgi:hypothetical protein